MTSITGWCYYKLYVGSKYDALDYLITDAPGEVLEIVGDRPWFYLRYLDEQGVHLRFRVMLADGDQQTELRIFSALHDGLSQLSQCPPNAFTPLVTIGEPVAFARNDALPVSCVKDNYEPEFDKFGGMEGIAIAETLFHRSSVVAREILRDEREGRLNRKDLALPIFVETVQSFLAHDEVIAFLERYASFWLSGYPAIGEYKTAFAERAYDMLDRGESPLQPATRLGPHASGSLAAWREALRRARDAYKKRCPSFSPALSDRLAFHFAHLMNNRLGFNALDESYLATLLAKSYEAGYGHAVA